MFSRCCSWCSSAWILVTDQRPHTAGASGRPFRVSWAHVPCVATDPWMPIPHASELLAAALAGSHRCADSSTASQQHLLCGEFHLLSIAALRLEEHLHRLECSVQDFCGWLHLQAKKPRCGETCSGTASDLRSIASPVQSSSDPTLFSELVGTAFLEIHDSRMMRRQQCDRCR